MLRTAWYALSNVYMSSHIETMRMRFSFMTACVAGFFFKRQVDENDFCTQDNEKWQKPSLTLAAEGAGPRFPGRKKNTSTNKRVSVQL